MQILYFTTMSAMQAEHNWWSIIEQTGLSYPVGDDTAGAKEWCQEAAGVFNRIEEYKDRNVNIFCTGSSGTILASMFATFINNPSKLVHVRKEGEKTHLDDYFHRPNLQDINIMIDDHISSGETVIRLHNYMLSKSVTLDCIIISNVTTITEREELVGIGTCSYGIGIM